MPFYGGRGDYYGGRGDFYRGDPFIGAIAVGAAKMIGRRFLRRATSRTLQTAAAAGATGYAMGQGSQLGGMGNIPVIRVDNRKVPARKDDPRKPKGYPKFRRTMNPLNPKALRRALRRAEGFEKFAARTVNALYRVIDGRKVRTFKKKSA